MLSSLLQTKAWARFKEQFGWHTDARLGFIGMERTMTAGKSLRYFPELPLNSKTLELIDKVRAEDVPAGRIFSRFEFLELWTGEKAKLLIDAGLTKAFEDVQPEFRQWILLDKSEDELLKEMKPKGRYNLRIAERHKLSVHWGTEEAKVEAFYSLYVATAQRTGFQGRDRTYFQKLIPLLKEERLGEVLTVSKDGEILSAAIITFYGGMSSYLYGGSGGDRSLMAPYLMHWEAIKRAKKEKCAIYDLLAIAPIGKAKHPHIGLTRFKEQLGGQSVRMLGCWDLVHNRLWYTIYRLAQKRRRRAI